MARKPYPSDVSNDESMFLARYLTLMRADAPQRKQSMRELLNGVRYAVKTGCQWRMLPHDLPPWQACHQQMQRWLAVDAFEQAAGDLRTLLRRLKGRKPEPSAAIFDSRTLRSSFENAGRAGYDGHKRKNGSKVHLAVDTLGHLLALVDTPADEGDQQHVRELSAAVQEATGENVDAV